MSKTASVGKWGVREGQMGQSNKHTATLAVCAVLEATLGTEGTKTQAVTLKQRQEGRGAPGLAYAVLIHINRNRLYISMWPECWCVCMLPNTTATVLPHQQPCVLAVTQNPNKLPAYVCIILLLPNKLCFGIITHTANNPARGLSSVVGNNIGS